MQQFVFVGSQGSFKVPPGESRIGSDAACHICIRGDGVLPIHAYVRTDGEKLLIRPADGGSSSSGHTSGSIAINGQPLTGPITLEGGQEVAIGTVQMRLLSNVLQKPPLLRRLWAKRWFKTVTWVGGSFAALLLLAYAVLVWVILDPATLKERFEKAVSANLLRDETEIESIQVRPFEGLITINNIRVKDRDEFIKLKDQDVASAAFIKIPSITMKLKPWPLLRSWFREYEDVQITVNSPEVHLQRSKVDGALNIRDILKKYSQSRSAVDLGLNKLNGTLQIKDGRVSLRDDFSNIGDTSLEDIAVKVSLASEGQPLAIDTCEMRVNAPAAKGTLKLGGHLMLIDSGCVIDSSAISSNDLRLDMERFDLARLFEHFGYAWEPHGNDFKVMLGKPITGHVNLKIMDLSTLRVEGGITSEALLAIKEGTKPPIGNIPMGLNFDLFLKDGGSGFMPHEMNVSLRSAKDLDKPLTTFLNFAAQGRLNPGGTSAYTVDMECILEEFFGTDVGKHLDLDGKLGGHLRGKAKLLREQGGNWKIDANVDLDPKDAYVVVADPADPAKKVQQPLPLNFEYHASARPNPDGGISELVVDKFSLRAPSFEASSEVPGLIRGLDKRGEMETQAQFILNLKGREFWTEFWPILKLFGFTQPIEEVLAMKVTLVGKNDLVSIAAMGTASRQWDPAPNPEQHDPAPVRLQTVIDFDRSAAFPRANNANPFLKVILEVISTEGKPMFVHVDALCNRDEKNTTYTADIAAFDHEKNLPVAGIKSDITTLRDRFQPYIEGYLKQHDAQPRVGESWLKRYRQTVLRGELEQRGRLIIQHPNDPKSQLPDRVEFDFSLRGKNLDLRMPLQVPVEGAAPPAMKTENWAWKEESPNISMKGSYVQRLADNKEEPDKEMLNLEVSVDGSVGKFEAKLQDVDLFKLFNMAKLPNQTWTDSAAALAISGQVDPPAFDLARSLHLLPQDNPFYGTVALQMGYDRKKDAVDLQKFQFKQTEKKPISFLLNADAAGSLLRVRELSARLFPQAEDAAPFAEQLDALLDENGPAALLDHLGDELALNSLQIDSTAFDTWLRQAYKNPNGRQPSLPVASLLRGDWKPDGTWKAAGVKFTRTDAKIRKWTLVGAFRNDFACFGAAPPKELRPTVFSFNHEWALRMGVAMYQNDNMTVAIDIDEAIFDKARIFASFPELHYDYEKLAGEPCKVALSQCLYSHGQLAQFNKLTVQGKPVSIEVKDFDASFARNAKEKFQVAEMILRGGPMDCALTGVKYEPDTDHIQAHLLAPVADLEYLTSLFPRLPPGLRLHGALKNVSGAYKGSVVSIRGIIDPAPTTLAARLNIDPADPRLLGLNPETDSLELDAEASGLRVSAASSSGEAADLKLGGRIHLTTRDLAWKEFSAELQHRTPNTAVVQAFSVPALLINSTDAKLTLLKASRAPGLPMNVSADLTFTTPIDISTLISANDLLGAAFNNTAPAKLSDERKLSALEQLVFNGKIHAPLVQLGETELRSFEAVDLSLKGLKLAIPAAMTDFYGGKIELNDSELDLNKAVVSQAQGKLNFKGVAFKSKLKVTDADVGQILGSGAKNGYFIAGKVGAQGQLRGEDFSGLNRQSWEGQVKLQLKNLSCQAPPSVPDPIDGIAPSAAYFTRLGPKMFAAFTRACSSETVNAGEMSKEFGGSAASGLALVLQTYLGKAFGVETSRLDFAPAEPTLTIVHGAASLDPVQLVGRGASAGVDLQLKNLRINLADEAFANEMLVYPVLVPAAARARFQLAKWPAAEQAAYTNNVETELPLRLSGRVAAASVKFPWAQLRSLGMRALFGSDKILDVENLAAARAQLAKWGDQPQDLEDAALVADRMGVGLPGTVSARNQGQSMLDRVPNLPPWLMEKLSVTGPTITPLESLNLMRREPEPPPGTKPIPPKNPTK